MWTLESFLISIGSMSEQDFLPALLFICMLIMTYGWSALSHGMKLGLFFAAGVVLFGGFFNQIIDRLLFPVLHSYMPLVIGGITAGLLELGAVLLWARIAVIGIFFCGAAMPLFLLSHAGFFQLTQDSVIPALVMIAAISILSSITAHKITGTKCFQGPASSLAGALGVFYISALPHGLPHWLLISAIRDHRLPVAIFLVVTGVIVQALIHLTGKRSRGRKEKTVPISKLVTRRA